MRQKRKDIPKLKKSFAPLFRAAKVELFVRESAKIEDYSRCGPAFGCCLAFDRLSVSSHVAAKVEDVFEGLFMPDALKVNGFGGSYWWPVFTKTVEGAESYTARIIALELAAILCEEFGT